MTTESKSKPANLPLSKSSLSAVLIASANDPGLASALDRWVTYFDKMDRDYEILLVVEAGSGHADKLKESLTRRFANVRLLTATGGFGAALRTGLKEASHPLLFYSRCNAGYQPSDIRLLLKNIDRDNLIAGFRTGKNGRSCRSWKDWLSRWLFRIFFGVPFRDPDCVFVLARRSLFRRIPIQSNGPFAHIEVLAKANFLGCPLWEEAIVYHPPSSRPAKKSWADARTVFFSPDFGPAILPEEAKAKSESK